MGSTTDIQLLNTLRPRQNGRHFPDDIFKCIFLNESIWIWLGISLKFVPKGPINNIPALVQIMAWRRPGDKPLSEPMLVCFLTHICVTRPQWVNRFYRVAKYVGFQIPFKCTNFDINRNDFEGYHPYSDSFVPFSQFGTNTRNMQQIWLPCDVLIIRGVIFQIYGVYAAVDHNDIYT